MGIDPWEELAQQVKISDATAVRKLRCPSCGGRMRHTLVQSHRNFLTTRCLDCKASLHRNGTSLPAWAAGEGNTIIEGE